MRGEMGNKNRIPLDMLLHTWQQFFFYGRTCLKVFNFWPLFYKGSIQSMDKFLMTIELLFMYPLFYKQNGSVFIMYAMNTSGIWASVNMKNWKGLPLKMTRWSHTSRTSLLFRIYKIVLYYKWLESVKYYTRFRWVIYVLPNIPISKSLKLNILGY